MAGIGLGPTYRNMAVCLQILATITDSGQLAADHVLLPGASLTGLGRECLDHLVIFLTIPLTIVPHFSYAPCFSAGLYDDG